MVDQEILDRQLDCYERGRVLKSGVTPQAWEVIYDTIHNYVEDVDQQTRNLRPGSPEIVAVHAALYALDQFEHFFKQDLEEAMEFSLRPPEEFKEHLSGVRKDSDVLAAMTPALFR